MSFSNFAKKSCEQEWRSGHVWASYIVLLVFNHLSAKKLLFISHQNFIMFNPFDPEFTIIIFIHYKPRIAVAVLDL